ncbi:hypothetical protein [Photobacterium rosenbergii]
MAGVLNARTRSRIMWAIKSKNTKPEVCIRKILCSLVFLD